MRFQTLTLALMGIAAGLQPSPAQADNPESARLGVRVFNVRQERERVRPIRFRIRHKFNAALEEGTSCTVELQACVSPFTPRGQRVKRDNRACSAFSVFTKGAGEGTQLLRFNTFARPVRKRQTGRSYQVSFQTRSECTDVSDNEESIDTNPRAKKISRNDNRGTSVRKFKRGIENNAR